MGYTTQSGWVIRGMPDEAPAGGRTGREAGPARYSSMRPREIAYLMSAAFECRPSFVMM